MIAACSRCLCDSSQPVSFSVDAFSVHHNLSLFCRLASIRVKCLGCLQPASGALTPPKLCVSVCVHVHFVSSSFLSFSGLPSHVHTDSNMELSRENKSHIKYTWKIRYFPSLSALSEIHLLANLLQSLLMFCRRLSFYPHTMQVIHLFVSEGFI